MSVVLPPLADGMLSLLGVDFPNVDEDAIRKDAEAWRTVLAGASTAGAEADAAVRGTQQVYRGDSATALAEHWNATGAGGGHLAQATAAAKVAPVALDGTADVVTAVKVAVGVQAAYAAIKVGRAMLAGGPLGASMAAAEMFSARHVIGKIMREGSEGTGKVLGPAVSSRVTEPLRRIMENLRRPGGEAGSHVLAGAGGARVPLRPSSSDRLIEGPWTAPMSGGRGGGRGRTEANANFSDKEQKALEARKAGQPYDRKAYNSAAAKVRKAEKFSGDRNKRKRDRT
jgi:hypothetical protein